VNRHANGSILFWKTAGASIFARVWPQELRRSSADAENAYSLLGLRKLIRDKIKVLVTNEPVNIANGLHLGLAAGREILAGPSIGEDFSGVRPAITRPFPKGCSLTVNTIRIGP